MTHVTGVTTGPGPAVPHPLMSVLTHGVPLTLLLDLASPGGPDSARICARETADLSWLAGLRDSVAPGRDALLRRETDQSRTG